MVTFTQSVSSSASQSAPRLATPSADQPGGARSLYFLADLELQSCQIAFSGEKSDKSSLSLAETWQTGSGIYLFLTDFPLGDPHAEAALDQRIADFLRSPSVRHTRFLWIENPTDPVFQWRFQALAVSVSSGGSGASDAVTVKRLTFFKLRNYGLAIAAGVICKLNVDSSGFVFALDPTVHSLPSEPAHTKSTPVYFSTGYGEHRLNHIQVNEAAEALALPITGILAGCFTFALSLQHPPKGEAFVELTQMDVALRMFFKSANPNLDERDPFSGFADLNADNTFLASSHRYPFLGEDAQAALHYSKQADESQNVTLYAALDLLQPLNEARSYFAFVAPGSEAVSDLSFPSCYHTNLGYSIHVTPHGYHDSRLVFAERLAQSPYIFQSPFYLVPKGAFTLSVPDYSQTPVPSGTAFSIREEDDFLCGLAGIEYIRLSSQHVNVLHLMPAQPAFTPDFVPNQIVDTQEAQPRLESHATTVWAAIEHVAATNFPVYFSQPEQSLLYRASAFQDGDQDATNDPLRFLEVPVTGLPPTEFLPIFPYGGVTGQLSHYQQMEEQLLYPQRHQRIRAVAENDTTPLSSFAESSFAELPLAASAEAPPVAAMSTSAISAGETLITGTTPQGLLATYPASFEMLNTLLLAKDTEDNALSLQRLARTSPLRLAFQSSQMFLVITDPASLKDNFPENQLTIQGWTFDLNPANWRQGTRDSNTVWIFKFIDKPLIDTLQDLALWEQPETFIGGDVDNIRQVRDRLVQRFEGAIATAEDPNASAKDRENAAPLARIATSLSWSGMIALNVSIPPSGGLPAELKALGCGIKDGNSFYAQYVGSNGTPVLPQAGTFTAAQSSLFGLLDYQDNSVPDVSPDGYAFQVSKLRVQFQNSQITAFSSELNLTLDRLFDEATQLLNSQSGRNIVVLKGFTEKHNNATTYAFSFSGANYFALPHSHILNNVDIIKATFTTDPPGSDPTVSIGRFSLWGRLNFRHLEAFDGFSFGSDTSLSDEVIKNSAALNSSARALVDDYQTGVERLAAAKEKLEGAIATLEANTQFLKFSKLTLSMECKHSATGTSTSFSLDPSQIAFDLARSQARPNSLYSKFPLKLVNFVHLNANKPDTHPKGYLPVKTPLGGSKMPSSGFGLNFELNLGSLGALAGAAQLVVNLLFVWEPNLASSSDNSSDNSPENLELNKPFANPFVGLRLPGFGGDVLGFPLQSVLKLSFKNVEMLRDLSQEKPAYLLKIKKVALKFFVLSLPPNGQTEIVVFGNPDATGRNDAIGWYAAYAKEPAALPEGKSGGRASPTKAR